MLGVVFKKKKKSVLPLLTQKLPMTQRFCLGLPSMSKRIWL